MKKSIIHIMHIDDDVVQKEQWCAFLFLCIFVGKQQRNSSIYVIKKKVKHIAIQAVTYAHIDTYMWHAPPSRARHTLRFEQHACMESVRQPSLKFYGVTANYMCI